MLKYRENCKYPLANGGGGRVQLPTYKNLLFSQSLTIINVISELFTLPHQLRLLGGTGRCIVT
jgi:hypothetical protein